MLVVNTKREKGESYVQTINSFSESAEVLIELVNKREKYVETADSLRTQ